MTDRTNLLLGCGAALVLAGAAQAATVNLLSPGTSGTLNGAIFETAANRPTGTGFINPFLRMRRTPTEQGYNTSGRPTAFDELTDPNFTRNLVLGALATRTINGINYFEFLVDVNEPNGGGQSTISLEQMKIFTSNIGSQTTTNVDSLGALRFDMDAGDPTNLVRYDDLNTGSGQDDIRILIPTAPFAGALSTDFVYVFMRFGDADNSEAGFEEIRAITGIQSVIPLPSAAGLGLAGLAGLAVRRRRV